MTFRRKYLPSINTLACSKAEILEPVLDNMNLSYLAQNHSSVTRLKHFVYRCQMYDTTKSLLSNMIQSWDIEFTLSIFNTLLE